ncbi:MAG: PIG-L family deacetylase [Phycisphaerales bacterium]
MASILVVGPHPDDQELALGGTIALLAAQGHTVTLLDMTNGEPTPFGDPATRAAEAALAAAALSAPGNPVRRIDLGLTNRRVEHTLAARHAVAGVIRRVAADVLFVPYFEDAHPDHIAVTRIAEDARFDAKLTKQPMPGDEACPPRYPRWLFHYYATHLRIIPAPSFIIDTSAHVQKKQQAIRAYRSQFERNPANADVPDRIAVQDAYFGSRILAAAGEPIFSREPLRVTDLSGLFASG